MARNVKIFLKPGEALVDYRMSRHLIAWGYAALATNTVEPTPEPEPTPDIPPVGDQIDTNTVPADQIEPESFSPFDK